MRHQHPVAPPVSARPLHTSYDNFILCRVPRKLTVGKHDDASRLCSIHPTPITLGSVLAIAQSRRRGSDITSASSPLDKGRFLDRLVRLMLAANALQFR
jgi:hypothetical protein